ncbi:hypothetical protein C2E23DRAFT_806795 [Lenzites betulinus]|nr:hypothetical protein C2E23DRAFT_806795 [Lenzites betulinus]
MLRPTVQSPTPPPSAQPERIPLPALRPPLRGPIGHRRSKAISIFPAPLRGAKITFIPARVLPGSFPGRPRPAPPPGASGLRLCHRGSGTARGGDTQARTYVRAYVVVRFYLNSSRPFVARGLRDLRRVVGIADAPGFECERELERILDSGTQNTCQWRIPVSSPRAGPRKLRGRLPAVRVFIREGSSGASTASGALLWSAFVRDGVGRGAAEGARTGVPRTTGCRNTVQKAAAYGLWRTFWGEAARRMAFG